MSSRWRATVSYNSTLIFSGETPPAANIPVPTRPGQEERRDRKPTFDFDEFPELDAFIEQGPHFATIKSITITYTGSDPLTIEEAEAL